MKETTRVLRETYMAPKLVQHSWGYKVRYLNNFLWEHRMEGCCWEEPFVYKIARARINFTRIINIFPKCLRESHLHMIFGRWNPFNATTKVKTNITEKLILFGLTFAWRTKNANTVFIQWVSCLVQWILLYNRNTLDGWTTFNEEYIKYKIISLLKREQL